MLTWQTHCSCLEAAVCNDTGSARYVLSLIIHKPGTTSSNGDSTEGIKKRALGMASTVWQLTKLHTV